MYEVVVRFTEIGGIVDDHWLNQLFYSVLNIPQQITEVNWLYIYIRTFGKYCPKLKLYFDYVYIMYTN
jgi:hypothetical protein